MTKQFTDTGRTAIFADGHSEKIFETYIESGMFAGATYEVTESELPTGTTPGHEVGSDVGSDDLT